MSVVVYLANTSMQIVVGDVKKVPSIQKIYHLEIEEGVMLNGVVISEYGLTQLLTSVWKRFQLPPKDIELVVSSAQFITKVATLPKMKEKKAMDLVRREFTDIENSEAYVFDYEIIEENKKAGMMTAVCVAATKEIIGSYMDVFEKAGLTLSRISDALGCQIQAFDLVRNKINKNYIVLNLDGTNLTSTLFIDYKYNYYNKSRVFSEKGSDDFATEIARTVSSILQFHSASGAEEGITDVYMGGFKKAEFSAVKEQIELLGLKVQSIPLDQVCKLPERSNCSIEVESSYEELVFCNYSHSIGAMVQTTKSINLVHKYDDSGEAGYTSDKAKPYIPLIVLAMVCILVSAGLVGWNFMVQKQIDQAEAFVSDPKNIELNQQAQTLTEIQETIQQQIASSEEAIAILNSYPKANSTVAKQVEDCAGKKVNITIESYDSASGAYVFIARAPVVTDIYNFINDLDETGLFANLEYSGYGYTEGTKQYDIHVSGYLSENAGKQ